MSKQMPCFNLKKKKNKTPTTMGCLKKYTFNPTAQLGNSQ